MRKKRYYLIGIAGVAMASLAGLLKKKGYKVAGSDQDAYPPMSNMLKSLKIPVFTPYNVLHVKRYRPDIVVVGNAIGRGNSELEYVISNGLLPAGRQVLYRSMSDILREEFIDGKKSIVITGTHGKTTTTALVAWILESAGFDPTIFVGGFMRNINSTFKLGKGKYVVLEGDEYDTAFFDKGPKFWHYRPFIGLVNNIELDHVDIYKDLDAIKFAFGRFINLIPKNGLLVVSCENKNSLILSQKMAKSPISTFGIGAGDWTAKNIKYSDQYISFNAHSNGHLPGGEAGVLSDIRTKLIGKYNISNILGAIAIAKFLKIPDAKIKNAIAIFEGVKRRQEIIGEKNGVTVIDDYAHHPTAVRLTLDAIRERFHLKHPKSRLICVFEPGSASSKRRVFEKHYIESFKHADLVYLYKPFKAQFLQKRETFNGKYVSQMLHKNGVLASNFDNIDKMLFHMKRHIKPGDVICIMSCRGFDGLYKLIWDIL
ncbi:MAG: Mur ligase family protein [bacterium]|nr:Mur ligase family protein [bacterium]